MTGCIFCEIIAGRAPANRVYEDEHVLAFMDIRPVTPGHLLVIPRRHAASLAELDPADGPHIFRCAQRLAAAAYASGLPCEGVNLFLADGPVAGQEVFHVHLHVLPRSKGDGFGMKLPPHYPSHPERAELETNAERIRSALK